MAERVLTIEDLRVSFDTYAGEVQAVRGVTLHVDEGEVLAVGHYFVNNGLSCQSYGFSRSYVCM